MKSEARNIKPTRRCPICKAETITAFQPFCSQRCSHIDLGKWLTNAYAIPGAADDEEASSPTKSVNEDDDRDS